MPNRPAGDTRQVARSSWLQEKRYGYQGRCRTMWRLRLKPRAVLFAPAPGTASDSQNTMDAAGRGTEAVSDVPDCQAE